MPLNLPTLLAYAGLIAAVILLATSQSRAIALVAVLASAIQVLRGLGLFYFGIPQVPTRLVLGAALAIPALIGWYRATSKPAVTAGAIATFVGTVQVLDVVL